MLTSTKIKLTYGIIFLVIGLIIGYFIGNTGSGTPDSGTTKAESKGPIKIGFLGPLTGDAASLGVSSQKAVELAAKELNDAGGINGRIVEVIYEDGKCNAKDASSAGNKLINLDKVPVIIGGLCSGETMAVAPVAEENKAVLISYCSSNPKITTLGDFLFRDYPSDSFQGAYGAEIAKNKLNANKAAVLYCLSDYCVGIKDVFKKTFEDLGGEIVIEESYEQESRDLRTALTKIKDADPDLIYFVGYTEASIVGIKQMKELGIDVPTLGADAWDDSKIWTETGNAGEGVMWTVVDTPISDGFKARMESIGAKEITLCAPQAYDAFNIITGIIKNVGTDGTKIKDELYKVKDYKGVSGTITIDSNGDLATASYVTKIARSGKGEILYREA